MFCVLNEKCNPKDNKASHASAAEEEGIAGGLLGFCLLSLPASMIGLTARSKWKKLGKSQNFYPPQAEDPGPGVINS